MIYTAILSRNFRDINTISTKVLLRRVEGGTYSFLHCWVSLDSLHSFVPKEGYEAVIAFTAKEKQYRTYGPVKTTLSSIKPIAAQYYYKQTGKSAKAIAVNTKRREYAYKLLKEKL